ncbi:Hypothetical_protein [Hexamita inflata]|uniref:Hypothetical_protein n=1 Tax=Hexamita inflata TaxID=28002 RepID=A0AA86Q251_9EUKA|nr:Hypothetical protein HINF_LOCUS32602 [Hexamita inflata]
MLQASLLEQCMQQLLNFQENQFNFEQKRTLTDSRFYFNYLSEIVVQILCIFRANSLASFELQYQLFTLQIQDDIKIEIGEKSCTALQLKSRYVSFTNYQRGSM